MSKLSLKKLDLQEKCTQYVNSKQPDLGDTNLTSYEITLALKNLISNKIVGYDGIVNKLQTKNQ